jgi:hypothetical protein
MRKTVAVVALALALTSCDRSHAHGELAKYLDASLHGKYEEAYQCISAADKELKTLPDYLSEIGPQKPIAEALAAKTSYEIKAVSINGDRATAEVAITGPDFSSLFSEAMGAAFLSAFGDEESKRKAGETLAGRLESKDIPITTVTQSFELVKEPDGWKVFLNWEFDSALADAKRLRAEEKWTEALAKYNRALELKVGNSEASKGKTEVERELLILEEKRAYIQMLRVKDFRVGRGRKYSFGDPERGVFGAVVNNGDRTLDEVQITVYFLDGDGKPIAETDYHPVLVTEFSFGSDNKPLRPGYIKEFGYVVSDKAPSGWSGKATVEITDIKFQQ